jgi:hypothetical protein
LVPFSEKERTNVLQSNDTRAARRPSRVLTTDVILDVGARSRLFLSHDFGAHGVRRSHLITVLQDDESLQIGLASRDRFLIPFKTNARHVRNVKQSVTNFIGLL